MLPYFDVSHVPASASFYSAVLQPLGIHYISTDRLTASTGADSKSAIITSNPAAVTYGTSSPPTPVFQIREARNSIEPLKLSRVVFSAPSPTAVTDFHSSALRANPALLLAIAPVGQRQSRPAAITTLRGDTHRATVTDLDGNTMEVVYQPPPNYPPSYAGSTVRKTQSTHDEVSRILDWNYDVAASESSPSPSVSASATMTSPTGHFPGNEPYTVLRRSVTTSVIETSPSANNDAPSTSSPLQTSTVVGSLLGAAVGAAAGAALTYSMLKKERARAPLQEFDGTGPAPPFQRRATFPEQYPDPQAAPARYVEVERTVEKIRYPEHYPPLPDSRAPPQYMAKYSQVGTRSRVLDDIDDDGRSRHSSRYQLEGASTVVSRSQAAVPRAAPLMLTDYEHQSNVGSRHSVAGKSAVPRSVVHDVDAYETGTHVSARSSRSQSTIRPPPPTVETELAPRSVAPSRAPTQAPSVVPSRAPTVARSRAPTVAPSQAPTAAPSRAPTAAPSRAPTAAPSRAPTAAPSRAPSKAPTQAPTYVPSKAPSKAPTKVPSKAPTAFRAPPSHQVFAYPPANRVPAFVPAHNVAMPRSGVGSSHANWEDDAVSVAPSDSISCIGSRTSRRQYH